MLSERPSTWMPRRHRRPHVQSGGASAGEDRGQGVAEIERRRAGIAAVQEGPHPAGLGDQPVHQLVDLPRGHAVAVPAQAGGGDLDREERSAHLVVALRQSGGGLRDDLVGLRLRSRDGVR